jgi:hypothetical protein
MVCGEGKVAMNTRMNGFNSDISGRKKTQPSSPKHNVDTKESRARDRAGRTLLLGNSAHITLHGAIPSLYR